MGIVRVLSNSPIFQVKFSSEPIITEATVLLTDSRFVSQPKHSIFFAVKGERHDGHQFIEELYQKGVHEFVVEKKVITDDFKNRLKKLPNAKVFIVENSIRALQNLVAEHRQKFDIPVVGITGSNGKTTTKELINAVLSKKYKTTATIGNLNNHIGVPLTLLSFTKDTEIGIVEMGANHQKEIEFLCQIALPDYGYITNFGKAHLEGFGGVEGVIKGKSEMYDYLKANDKFVFVNSDDSIQVEKTSNINSFTFAINNLLFVSN